VEALGVPGDRVVVVGNGVDTTVFSPDGPAAEHQTPYFVYTGTMSEWQGADVFVRALARHRETHPGARLVFLGQGTALPALTELAQRLVPGAVDFKGVVPPAEAARWLRGATAALVSIVPGKGYDFAKPTKIYAATACGVPVIFAGTGASRELVMAEQLGWAPDYNTDAVALAMASATALGGHGRAEKVCHLVDWTRAHASLSAAGMMAARTAGEAAGLHS
jgi:glycosyltransferase involved in cell wall biosynthesis